MSEYVLFYSNKCLHSKELINLLYKDQDLFSKFVKVNIDVSKVKIPPYIKSVPSAIIPINGIPKLLIGTQIFNWYNENHTKTLENNQINEYEPSTMSGYSDNFSYLDNGTCPMDKSYLYLNKMEQCSIITPDDNNSDKNKKLDENNKTQFDYNLEKYVMQRNNDITNGINRI